MLTARSLKRLEGVHKDLAAVIKAADNRGVTFQVTEGLRTLERQKELVAKGASKTMNSRHLTGHAVDLVVTDPTTNAITWELPFYRELANVIKAAAKELNIPIVWGGDWVSFVDGPHFELDRKVYPSTAVSK